MTLMIRIVPECEESRKLVAPDLFLIGREGEISDRIYKDLRGENPSTTVLPLARYRF